MGTRATRNGVAMVAIGALALAACSQERTFSAEEFVDEINAEGVELRLGDELFTEGEDKELYALELEPVTQLPGEDGEAGHTGGSLSVYEDAGGADGEMESCQAAADLLCYQASNIVVVLEGGGIESQQLGVAMQRLSEE